MCLGFSYDLDLVCFFDKITFSIVWFGPNCDYPIYFKKLHFT